MNHLLLAAATDGPPPVWSPDWWSTFTTSSAFAGVAAVAAAAIALISVSVRGAIDSSIATKQRASDATAAELVRDAAVEDRDFATWWSQYDALKDRLNDMDPADALVVLDALGETAPHPVAVALVAVASRAYAPAETEEA
ncbi:MAG: hypothetical protein NVV66_16305 [Cellulomonas sp.]|uniref:hypothetical protein n=1 Tax=Cellulomonas sp. TaxID=40001 RepID=UPI002585D0E7|nr:hypothetical protein [Cellulomonas sp.]MCR6706180.1 hypothetical protein [Cellulomonas sp.]